MVEERRANPRATTKIEITFKESGAFFKAYMLNVSRGGLFIKTDSPLVLETSVLLLLKLPSENETLEIDGRVVWVNPKSRKNSFPKGMGIQFVNMKPEDEEKIKNFVEEHLKEIENYSIM